MEASLECLDPLTVRQKTQGFAQYLLANVDGAKQCGVVVGGGAEPKSEELSRLATAVLIATGIKVYRLGGIPVHAALVAFGVKSLNAAAGLMISASTHPPVLEHGYKSYSSNGYRITPSIDAGIAVHIKQSVEPIEADENAIEDNVLVANELDHVREAYYEAVTAAMTGHYQADFARSPLPFVYTPLHGVGLPSFEAIVANLKIPSMTVVRQMASSDSDHPTVKVLDLEKKVHWT